MKILIVLPKFTLGGVETMCENLACALQDAGHTPVMVSLYTYESAITRRLNARGVRIFYLDKKKGFDPFIKGRLTRLIESEAPDAVHMHLYVTKYAVPATRAAAHALGHPIPMIHTMHNIASLENETPFGNALNRRYYRKGDVTVVAISKNIRDSIVDFYGIPAKEIPVVYNGVPLNRCLIKTNYETEEGDGAVIHIVNIGRFTSQKNQIELIRAMKIVHEVYPQAVLDIYGEGELRGALEDEIADADYIKLCGVVDDAYEVLRAADVFALPSEYEGFPMTLIEAMGTGCPIVATPVGGVTELISDHETGLLCDTYADSIAYAIAELLASEALRASCGKAALAASSAYSDAAMAQGYLKVYNR